MLKNFDFEGYFYKNNVNFSIQILYFFGKSLVFLGLFRIFQIRPGENIFLQKKSISIWETNPILPTNPVLSHWADQLPEKINPSKIPKMGNQTPFYIKWQTKPILPTLF